MARRVADAAILVHAVAGFDLQDATSLNDRYRRKQTSESCHNRDAAWTLPPLGSRTGFGWSYLFNAGSSASRPGGTCWSTAFIMKPALKYSPMIIISCTVR